MWLSFQKYTWWKLEQPFCVQVLSSEAKDREPCLPRKYKAPKSQDPERPKCGCEPKKEKEGLNALFPDLSSVSSTRKNRWVGFPQSGIFLIGDHEYGIAWVFFYWPTIACQALLELLQLETSEHFPHLLEKLEHQVDLAWVPRLVVKVRQSLQKNGRVKKKQIYMLNTF